MARIQFKLDGKDVTAQDGETIWQVTRREGTRIPHLCWPGQQVLSCAS